MTYRIELVAACLLAPVLAMLPACIGPGCLPDDLGVRLQSDRTVAVGTLSAALTATANGTHTCGSAPRSTEIVEYRWDLDGDGTFEQRGAMLDRVEVTFEEPGVYPVTVEVVDSDGLTAQSSQDLEVLTSLEPADALARLRVWLRRGEVADCTSREVCVQIDSELAMSVDATLRVVHRDGTTHEVEREGIPVDLGAPGQICVDAGFDVGDVIIQVGAGDATRTEGMTVWSGSVPDGC